VGDNKPIKIDVRIISATNKDLMQLVDQGKFREDLYYRLKVFPIHVPPLRERKDDIPLLVDHFIKKFNQENNKQAYGCSPEVMRTILNYSWPGNIRELENALEYAFVVTDAPLPSHRKGICCPKISPLLQPFHQKTICGSFWKNTIGTAPKLPRPSVLAE